jgi:hypothetical protein
LHILSVSVFVEFVCLLVQLLLVTCVSSLFHLTLAVTPTVTPRPLGFPSLSRGAVGQKKKKKTEKKESNPKKGTKKRENPKEKRDRRTVQVVSEFVLVEGVFRGVRFRFCHGIPYLSCYSPRYNYHATTHHIQSLALLLRERERVHVVSCYLRSSVFILSVFGAP